MPTTSRAAQRALKERSALATRQLRDVVGRDDLDLLAIALAEVATAEAQHNPAFIERVHAVYDGLVEVKSQSATAHKSSSPTSSKTAAKDTKPPLVPIAIIKDHVLDPWAPPDPYYLNRLFGPEQLYAALDRYNLPTLKRSLPLVQAKHPGTKPRRISSKDDVITYMVTMVVEEQANTGAATA